MLRDHLGSVDMVTDEGGNTLENLSYEAWGKRRLSDWKATTLELVSDYTRRGFTGHEHLEEVGLIHMNGRVYDPTLGRFLSADPFIQAPESTQGFNLYTYVNNNPLSFTDPSGFFSVGGTVKVVTNAYNKAKDFVKSALRNPIVQVVGIIAIGALSGGTLAPFTTAAFAALTTAANERLRWPRASPA